MFCCTHIEKCVTVDDYHKGCSLERRCVMADNVFIRAETMAELIRKINARYALEIDDVWIGDCENGVISYDRQEDGTGYPPQPFQVGAWTRGEHVLYLADFTFCIEKFVEERISVEDFAGVTTHE